MYLPSQTSKMEIICYPFICYRIQDPFSRHIVFKKPLKFMDLVNISQTRICWESQGILVSLGLDFRNIWLLLGFVMVIEILSRFSAPTLVPPSRTEQFPACSFYKCVSCTFLISFRWLFHILQIVSGIMN